MLVRHLASDNGNATFERCAGAAGQTVMSFSAATNAGAICDRLIENAHVVWLKGPSMRKKKGIGSKDYFTTT
jgi:hypothetical protein